MRLNLALEPRPEAATQARREVDRLLAGTLAPQMLSDLRLIVSELVTNAFVHGPRRDPIEVRLNVHDAGLVTGEVIDGGEGHVAIRQAAADETGGWGLRVMDRLASSWGVFPGSTHVWFELRSQ